MSNNPQEIRCSVELNVEERYSDAGERSGHKLAGYAVKFNDITTIGGQFQERVMPTAFEGVNMDNTLALGTTTMTNQ